MIDWAAAKIWQALAAVAGLVAAALLASTVVFAIQVRGLEKDIASINDTLTSTRADLTTCRQNQRGLEAGIELRNRMIMRITEEGAERLAAAEAAVAAAENDASQARRKMDRLLRTPVAGDTLCERVAEADRLVLETLR